MTRVYQLSTEARTPLWWLRFAHRERDWGISQRFTGQSLASTWQPPEVRLVKDPRGRLGDVVPLDGSTPPVFVFTAEAASRLIDMLQPFGELLPLDCDEGKFLAYNITTTIDALDEAASDIHPGDTISLGHPFVFRNDRVTADAFKVPQSLMHSFVTGAFERRVREEGLEGLAFLPYEVI